MQNMHFSFCCIAHIFRLLKETKHCPEQVRVRNTNRKDIIMFETLKTRITAWKRYSRTVSELEALSNRELADLGIMRTDIGRIARDAAR